MKIEFLDNIDYKNSAILISGSDTIDYSGHQLLSVDFNNEIRFYEIKYKYHCSPFKGADLFNNILIVGFEDYFYMFDTNNNKNLLSLKLSGYFGHFYRNDHLIYVTDASGIHCLNIDGTINWQNNELGIDGVEINKFDNQYLYGSGEWDPPGGWIDFILDKETGGNKK